MNVAAPILAILSIVALVFADFRYHDGGTVFSTPMIVGLLGGIVATVLGFMARKSRGGNIGGALGVLALLIGAAFWVFHSLGIHIFGK